MDNEIRLINANALKEFINNGSVCDICPNKKLNCAIHCDFPDYLTPIWEKVIDSIPTIDDLSKYSDKLWKLAYERGKAEGRKTGHWYERRIDEQYGNPPHGFLTRYEWRCSECEDVPCYEHDIHTLNFCPNCGAKMTKEAENE